jgi:hypothetical protein
MTFFLEVLNDLFFKWKAVQFSMKNCDLLGHAKTKAKKKKCEASTEVARKSNYISY